MAAKANNARRSGGGGRRPTGSGLGGRSSGCRSRLVIGPCISAGQAEETSRGAGSGAARPGREHMRHDRGGAAVRGQPVVMTCAVDRRNARVERRVVMPLQRRVTVGMRLGADVLLGAVASGDDTPEVLPARHRDGCRFDLQLMEVTGAEQLRQCPGQAVDRQRDQQTARMKSVRTRRGAGWIQVRQCNRRPRPAGALEAERLICKHGEIRAHATPKAYTETQCTANHTKGGQGRRDSGAGRPRRGCHASTIKT